MRGNTAAIVPFRTGGFLLLTHLAVINISLFELLRTWWFAVLTALGSAVFLTLQGIKKASLPSIDGYYFYSYKTMLSLR